MSRICKKCGAKVPRCIWVDGKKRNCQNRKYCFDCSPFGRHNTSQIEKVKIAGTHRIKVCPDCGKEHYQKGNRCFPCYFKVQSKRRSDKVSGLIGGFKCWKCGYDKCKTNINFHHLNDDKLFGLSTREMMLKWDRVWIEVQKCVVLCGNCHGEVHEGLTPYSEIRKLWEIKWKSINNMVP